MWFILYSVLAFWLITLIFFRHEIKGVQARDPAARSAIVVVLLYSGLHAIVFHRIAHALWQMKLTLVARALSQLARLLTGIEIHPGAVIGKNLFIDHGMGVVIGETSIVGNNVTLYQGVTLGGTGKETGKRHPTLGDSIVVGAGAKVLGNITIGNNSYIGANAVVIKNVPPNTTVVGVPGHVTKQDGERIEQDLDHAHILDPVMQHMAELTRRVHQLEHRVGNKEK